MIIFRVKVYLVSLIFAILPFKFVLFRAAGSGTRINCVVDRLTLEANLPAGPSEGREELRFVWSAQPGVDFVPVPQPEELVPMERSDKLR